jgi:hypothetical protein
LEESFRCGGSFTHHYCRLNLTQPPSLPPLFVAQYPCAVENDFCVEHSRFKGIVFYVQNRSKGDESKENPNSPVGSSCDLVTAALAMTDIGLSLIAEL